MKNKLPFSGFSKITLLWNLSNKNQNIFSKYLFRQKLSNFVMGKLSNEPTTIINNNRGKKRKEKKNTKIYFFMNHSSN